MALGVQRQVCCSGRREGESKGMDGDKMREGKEEGRGGTGAEGEKRNKI